MILLVPSVPGGARDTGIRRHNMECSECSTNWPFLGEEIKLTIDDTGQMKPDCCSIAKQQTNTCNDSCPVSFPGRLRMSLL